MTIEYWDLETSRHHGGGRHFSEETIRRSVELYLGCGYGVTIEPDVEDDPRFVDFTPRNPTGGSRFRNIDEAIAHCR